MDRQTRGGVRGWHAYLVVGLGVVLAYYLMPGQETGRAVRVAVSCLVGVSAAVALGYGVWRHRPAQWLPWLLLGVSQLVYAGAAIGVRMAHLFGATVPWPAVNLLYLSHYPLLVVALSLLVRARIPGRDVAGLLDAGVLVVVAALPYWLYLIEPHSHTGASLAVRAVCVGYPLMDLALLAVALRLMLGAGRRPAAFLLLSAYLAAILTADTGYAVGRLHGSHLADRTLSLVWLAGDLCLGAAALHPSMRRLGHRSSGRAASRVPLRVVTVSALAFTAPVMLLVEFANGDDRDIPATGVACALLFGLTIARVGGLAADQRRSAITDALTGLHTRQFVEAQLALEVARARRAGTEVAILVVDIDDFKSVNDRYGHTAGDRVLVEIAGRLRRVTRPGDVLGRYGGEEFAVLAPGVCPDELPAMARRLSERLTGSPLAVSANTMVMITVSVGAVSYPSGGEHPEELVAAVDRALARAKERDWAPAAVRGPGRPGAAPAVSLAGQAPMVDFLRQIADQVDLWLSAQEHSTAISRWATVLAGHLGLDEATGWRLELAGRLHDIGKIVVPEAILTKPSRLTDEEWRLLRQHPDHGSRLARLVPGFDAVAESIRQHHERYDGNGYPDRLAGSGIRLEARIIAVCDSWAAMRSDRAYQAALSEDQAREQMWAGRGTQFDPDLVDLFLSLHERGEVGALRLLRPAAPPASPPGGEAAAGLGVPALPGGEAAAGPAALTGGEAAAGLGVPALPGAAADPARTFQKSIP